MTDLELLYAAFSTARWSPSPTTQVGCALAWEDRIVATGYNHPSPYRPDPLPEGSNPYDWGVHAEAHAVDALLRQNSRADRAAVTWMACTACATRLIHAGVEKVIAWNAPEHPKWENELHASRQMLERCQIELVVIGSPDAPLPPIMFNGRRLVHETPEESNA